MCQVLLTISKELLKMEKQKRISFGYTRNDMNEIVIYEEQAEVVKLIFEFYSFDQSLSNRERARAAARIRASSFFIVSNLRLILLFCGYKCRKGILTQKTTCVNPVTGV